MIQQYYNKIYGSSRTVERKSLYSSFMNYLLRKYGVTRYNLALQHLPGGESILDIGCGNDFALMPLWYTQGNAERNAADC